MTKVKLIIIILVTVLLVGNLQAGMGGDRGAAGGARGGGMAGGFGGMGGGRGGGQVNDTLYPDTPASQEVIDELVATLRSADASRMEKSDALRQLAVVGNEGTISVIAPLLADEELSHMARFALQPMPFGQVDVVLRNALDSTSGLQLAGVIHSIGIRGDTEAVPKIAALLKSSDQVVAQAAAKSLGSLGNSAAASALRGVVASADSESAYQNAVCEGLFRCAEALGGNQAIEIYDQVLALDAINSIRTAALRGAILARGNNGVRMLSQYLTGEDYTLFVAAARTAQEMTASGTTRALTDALDELPADRQILVMWSIGKRGDTSAAPAILALINNRSTAKDVRVEAIKVMPQIPSGAAVPVLIALMNDSDADIADAAKTAVSTMPGSEADNAVLAMLKSNQASERLVAVELVEGRGIKGSLSDVIRMAGSDSDASVRQAALEVAGNMGSADDLPALLELAMSADAGDMDAAVTAISSVLTNVEDTQAFTEDLLGRLDDAQATQKAAILRLLSITGGSEALNAVRSAVNDSNESVRDAALQALSDWPDFEAVGPLLDIAADSDTSLVNHVLALRGAANLIRNNTEASLDERVEFCLNAYNITRRDDERREVISVMGTLRSVAIGDKLVEIATENEALRNEAGLAAIQVATSLYTGRAAGGARGGMRGGMMGGGQRGGQQGGRGGRGNSANAVTPSIITTSISPVLATGFGGGAGGARGGAAGGARGGAAGGARGGMMGGFGGFGRAGGVQPTEEEMAAAQEIARRILALNISEEINTTAQSIIDGTIATAGGRGGMGQRGGMGDRGGMDRGAMDRGGMGQRGGMGDRGAMGGRGQ